MRVLAVISGEFLGADEGRDWATLSTLVASNSPQSPVVVRVLALVNTPSASIVFGNPLARAVGVRAAIGSGPSGRVPTGHDPANSAHQRLDRAVQRLRELGLRGNGDIEPGDPYTAVRREVSRGNYERVLLLCSGSRKQRLALYRVARRLQRALDIPVEAPGTRTIAPPTAKYR